MRLATTRSMDGYPADRRGGEPDGTGIRGSMRTRSCRAMEFSIARLAGDSIRLGGCTKRRFMDMATAAVAMAMSIIIRGSIITSTQRRPRQPGDWTSTTHREGTTRMGSIGGLGH